MGDKTAIEWTDATWNPVTGCDRVSPGCDNCYALTLAARLQRMGAPNYQNDGDPRSSGPGFGVTCHPHMLDQPLRWTKPRRIFVNSMSDLFHARVPSTFVADVFLTMARAPRHTFQILTKRPHRMAALLADRSFIDSVLDRAGDDCEWPLPNVWLGTSIESDRETGRADFLRRTSAAVRFVSAEPLLGPLPSLCLDGIDWLIVGGESGPGARPMHPAWARDLRNRCAAGIETNPETHGPEPRNDVPGWDDWNPDDGPFVVPGPAFLFKQWGSWAPVYDPALDDGRLAAEAARTFPLGRWLNTAGGHGFHGDQPVLVVRRRKRDAGRLLDGRTWDEFPTT